MDKKIAITLIVCGTLCCLAPWGYESFRLWRISELLAAGNANMSVTIHNTLEFYKWWSLGLGLVMIVAAIISVTRSCPEKG